MKTLLANLSIRSRLMLGFACVLGMMLLLTTIGISNVNFVEDTLAIITDKNSVKQRYAINFRGSVHDRAIAIRDVVLTESDQNRQDFINEIRELEAFYNQSRQPLEAALANRNDATAKEVSIYQKIQDVESKTLPIVNQVISLASDGHRDAAKTLLLLEVRPAFIQWLAVINEFIDFQEVENQKQTAIAQDTTHNFSRLMLALTAVALVISLIISFGIVANLRKSIGGEPKEVASTLYDLSNGELRTQISQAQTHSILHSVSVLQAQLREIVSKISDSATQVESQTETIVQGAADVLDHVKQQNQLTQGAQSKLASMQELVQHSSELMSVTEENSQKTTEFAKQGSQAIQSTAEEVSKVSITLTEAADQIARLDEKTKEIAGITNVIGGISEQTNLLALNAAIEAARAGEQGRGFAVVADEVRTLAQRTAEATTEIGTMLQEVTEQTLATVDAMEKALPQIQNSLDVSNEAQTLLADIERQATDSLNKVIEVVQASSAQKLSIDELYADMDQINQMAQSTTQSLTQNSEVGSNLDSMASDLKQQISLFKL